jgi:tetratricopeptide (TPR) repeat protein
MAISARIEELERKFNENPRRYFAPLANEYRKAGDLTQAISICRTYVPQQPAHMSGHIVFGQALFEAGEFEEARGVFESALQLDPENLIALRHLGDIARARGELNAARTWYRRVLDADPRNPEVVALLSSIDGLPDSQAPRQSSPVEALSGWQDINPERTLELPPTLATPPAPPPVVEATPVLTPAIEEPPPAAPVATGGMEGFYSAERDLEEMQAAPPAEAETAMGSGFESMEFVAPKREDRPEPPPLEALPESDTPSAFVTETMAELYLQQGFRDEALAVYRQLLAQSPHDDSLRERVAQLESGSRSSMSMAEVSDSVIDAANDRRSAPSARTVRSFFSGLAARRVVTHHEAAPASQAPTDVEQHTEFEAEPVHAEPVHAEPVRTEAVESESVPAEPGHAEPVHAEPVHAEPVHAEPVHAEPVHSETIHTEAISAEPPAEVGPPPAPPAHHDDVHGYSDEAFSDDAFGANAFTSTFKPRTSSGVIAREDFSSESLVSRVTEELDVFGLPLRTEQSEPQPDVETPPAAPPAPASSHEAAPATEGSMNGLFAGSSIAPTDDAAASTLAGAFGGLETPPAEPAPERGGAARPAATELSLDSVFREGPGSGESGRRESSAFSFDQFFGSDANAENVSPIEGTAGSDADSAGVETEQFSSWLSGLKKK